LSGDDDSFSRLQSLRQKRVARLFLVIALVFLALWLARDFLAPIGWASVIAIATWPLYMRFASRFRHRKRLAPLLFTLMVVIILLFPIMIPSIVFSENPFLLNSRAAAFTILCRVSFLWSGE